MNLRHCLRVNFVNSHLNGGFICPFAAAQRRNGGSHGGLCSTDYPQGDIRFSFLVFLVFFGSVIELLSVVKYIGVVC